MMLSVRDWMISSRDVVEAGWPLALGWRGIGKTIIPSSVFTRQGMFSSSTGSMLTGTRRVCWLCAGDRPCPSGHSSTLFRKCQRGLWSSVVWSHGKLPYHKEADGRSLPRRRDSQIDPLIPGLLQSATAASTAQWVLLSTRLIMHAKGEPRVS